MKGRRALIIAALIGLLAGFDFGAPPARQWSSGALVGAIRLYQGALSPLLARSGVRCRFEPTCSVYGVGVLRRYGALGGTWRAAWRVMRCAPWTPSGTVDPP